MVFYLPYKSIRHTKLDERKIIILNQGIEYYITDKLLEIEYWVSVYIKSLYLSLFLSTSLFIGLSIEHLYLLRDTNQKIVKNLTSAQGNNKQNTAKFVFVNNVLVLPYEKNKGERVIYLKENISNYSILAKVQMQLEIDNHEMIKQFEEQKTVYRRCDVDYFIQYDISKNFTG